MARQPTTENAPRGPVAASGPGRGAPSRRRGRRAAWLLLVVALLAVVGGAWYEVHRTMPAWYARLWYPLEYESPINEESARNGLDPALVAAVIDTESGFAPDSRSAEGAVGLMQLLPQTARFVAELPDRPSPPPDRLEVPEVNIAYGTRYLRYLIDRHGGRSTWRWRPTTPASRTWRTGWPRPARGATTSRYPTTSRSPRRAASCAGSRRRRPSTGARTATASRAAGAADARARRVAADTPPLAAA